LACQDGPNIRPGTQEEDQWGTEGKVIVIEEYGQGICLHKARSLFALLSVGCGGLGNNFPVDMSRDSTKLQAKSQIANPSISKPDWRLSEKILLVNQRVSAERFGKHHR
jgi:hypothetical protein